MGRGDKKTFVMAGDVGGTNARFALFNVPKGSATVPETELLKSHQLVFTRNYKNNDFAQFADAVSRFLQDVETETGEAVTAIATACFAVAGPVFKNVVQLTNRGWNIAAPDLERTFNIGAVKLVNDFAANGYGLLTLDTSEYEVLQEGKCDPTAPIGLIGAGTGLGECFLTSKNGEYDAFPCEGGHVEFAPRSDIEVEMLQFLSKKFGTQGARGRVSCERIVSGKGIVNVYEFLAHRFPDKVDKKKHEEIMASPEGGRVPIRLVRSEDLGLRGAHVVATRLLVQPTPTAATTAIASSTTPSTSRPCAPCGPCGPCHGVCGALATVAVTSITAAFAGAAFYHMLSRRT
ncbi:hypothetical protein PTSG_09250 [Salpingoeca rosetta]|uniref:Glucokinase n=1 Tax=Salpingoeca rosetta (strain ATCC 50818 / BSB-021) TaxID=946362 RepID=F2UN57_SALR5|nr:uncharacterized protein PTSG_09250 [Salpingoeca rosetta]EGD78556.1 hypothetical protein PTSG_09250 [Salpingoeca rosetta]|eukprot:XP_004989505.1 hypothetical protein PTSG_09250 [Salpingoeca rosetta]